MNSLIQSNIQINASDVSNAIFAELQKKLIENRNTLKSLSSKIYVQAADLSSAYIETAKAIVEEKEKVFLDQLCLLLSTRLDFTVRSKIGFGARPFMVDPGHDYLFGSNFNYVSSYRRSFVCRPAVFHTILYDPNAEDAELASVDLVGLTIITDDHHTNRLTCGEDATFLAFKNQIEELYEKYIDLKYKEEKIQNIINGDIDPNTGLTLKDHIGASIATRAISQIPELAGMLNMDSISMDISTKLIRDIIV